MKKRQLLNIVKTLLLVLFILDVISAITIAVACCTSNTPDMRILSFRVMPTMCLIYLLGILFPVPIVLLDE